MDVRGNNMKDLTGRKRRKWRSVNRGTGDVPDDKTDDNCVLTVAAWISMGQRDSPRQGSLLKKSPSLLAGYIRYIVRVKNFIFVPFLFFKLDPATFKDICNNWRKYIWSTIFLFFSFFVNGILNCKNYYKKSFFFSKNYFTLFSFKYLVSYLRNIIWLKKVNFLEWLFLMFHYSIFICILFEIFIRLKLERMISFKIFRNFFSFQILSFLEAFKGIG